MRNEDHPLYSVWRNMRNRCSNSRNKQYRLYGARGITYDPKWDSFDAFIADMQSSYSPGLQLDRIDNNGNYCKDNCRWATRKEQNNNRSNNKWITYNGMTKTLAQWAEYLGINIRTLSVRVYVYKWDITKCFTTPIRKWHRKSVKVQSGDETLRF